MPAAVQTKGGLYPAHEKAEQADKAKGERTGMKYKVQYIDGHDLKYKTFTVEARTPEVAVRKMRDSYEADFDHQIIDVYKAEEKKEAAS